ncbi:hypothetical protein PTKIN_Ptkin10aG0099100 [Pterospermum kingtungense]
MVNFIYQGSRQNPATNIIHQSSPIHQKDVSTESYKASGSAPKHPSQAGTLLAHWYPYLSNFVLADYRATAAIAGVIAACTTLLFAALAIAANILLDEKFEAVVGDFGLAKLMNYKDTHVTTVVRGTIGHIAPEYLSTGKSSEKTDVFGYGVLLLELITAQKVSDIARLAENDDLMLLDWLSMGMLKFQVKGLLKEGRLEMLVDSNLQGNYKDEEVEQLMQVALLCTMCRPKMSEVVRMLEGTGSLAENWHQLQKEEMLRQEFNHNNNENDNWIIADST